MNEEVIKMIAESPDALKAFESWMNLQWAEFIGLGLLTVVVLGAAITFVVWLIKNETR